MYINQKLIAEKSGVSCATVSRAFTKNAKVRPDTLKKIQDAMADLGIDDPATVLESSSQPVKQVLIIVGDVSDEFHANAIKGISDQLHNFDMITVLCNSNYDFETEERYLEYAENNHFAGVIILSVVENPRLVELLHRYSIPVILVNRYIRALDMDVVCIDNYRGGYMAAQHLLENGHQHIAYLAGGKNSTAQQDRLRGFSDAMIDAHLPLLPSDIYWGDNSRSSGRDFTNHFFSQKSDYTAVFAATNPMAVGTLTRLRELGYQVPDDVSILCFDDTQLAHDGRIKLSTVSYAPYQMGIAAVDSLLSRIKRPFAEKIKLTYSPYLTERESVRNLNI